MTALHDAIWRVDGRIIYAQPGPRLADTDPLIGVMDSPTLAAAVVEAHNQILRRHKAAI